MVSKSRHVPNVFQHVADFISAQNWVQHVQIGVLMLQQPCAAAIQQ
jgi:hypothetical protein